MAGPPFCISSMGFTGFCYLQYYLSVLYRYNCGILPQFLKGNQLAGGIGTQGEKANAFLGEETSSVNALPRG